MRRSFGRVETASGGGLMFSVEQTKSGHRTIHQDECPPPRPFWGTRIARPHHDEGKGACTDVSEPGGRRTPRRLQDLCPAKATLPHHRPGVRGKAHSKAPIRRNTWLHHHEMVPSFPFMRPVAKVVHEVSPYRASTSTGSGAPLCTLDDFAHACFFSLANFFQGIPEFRLQTHTGPTTSDHDVAGDQPAT